MILKVLVSIILLALLVLGATYWFACPCDRIPGGPLRGDSVEQPISDWSFVNSADEVPLCQIEVDFPITRSMNVNCMSVDKLLYVSCSGCADKQWAARALTNPLGKVRAAQKVYPIRYQRITSEADLDRIWSARLRKIGAEPVERPGHWWSFHLAAVTP